jgi:serine protease Do
MLLSAATGSDFYGSPLLNSSGEMIGILEFDHKSSREMVVPINYFKRVIGSLLRENKIKRPALGLYYMDLSKNYGLSEEVASNINKGALVWNSSGSAFKLKSPAKLAGLTDQDIILKIEGEEINGTKDLTSLIQDYAPNDRIKLNILRHNVVKDIEVVLGEMSGGE